MTSTPPPRSIRARTPPTPRHGPQSDDYEPYRRSTRSSAHSNPYSSFNSDRSPTITARRAATTPPPSTVRKARFARAPTHLSSPPSSPASPLRHRVSPRRSHGTPRKHGHASSRSAVMTNGALSDSDQPSSLAAPFANTITMLPTPSKTPSKHRRAMTAAARIVSFQPSDPNDVMPASRKLKKHAPHSSRNGFELYDEDLDSHDDKIEIFTDANARVPAIDDAPDNPFVGSKKNTALPRRRSNRRTQAAIDEDARIEAAVRNDEGVVYVFRGKKIFRRFEDTNEGNDSSSGSELGQRSLKRKAGATAQRPLTRSTVKPRLLFPSEEQLRQRELADEVDEEAVTDIEMPSATSTKGANDDLATPSQDPSKHLTPPPSNRIKKAASKKAASAYGTPIYEDEAPSAGLDDTFPKQTSNPFDAWPRTKAGRKRAGDVTGESSGPGKRTRSALVGSPT